MWLQQREGTGCEVTEIRKPGSRTAEAMYPSPWPEAHPSWGTEMHLCSHCVALDKSQQVCISTACPSACTSHRQELKHINCHICYTQGLTNLFITVTLTSNSWPTTIRHVSSRRCASPLPTHTAGGAASSGHEESSGPTEEHRALYLQVVFAMYSKPMTEYIPGDHHVGFHTIHSQAVHTQELWQEGIAVALHYELKWRRGSEEG